MSQQDRALHADLIEFIITTLVAQLLQLYNCCISVNHEAAGHTHTETKCYDKLQQLSWS